MTRGTLVQFWERPVAYDLRPPAMATDATFIDFIREQTLPAGRMSFKKMFGEYGVYFEEKIIGLVCDNQLFLKPTDAGRRVLGDVREAAPYPGAKPHFLIGEQLDDPELMTEVIRATAAALPAPKPKAVRKKK